MICLPSVVISLPNMVRMFTKDFQVYVTECDVLFLKSSSSLSTSFFFSFLFSFSTSSSFSFHA